MTKIINELSVNMCKLTKVKNWREKRQKNIFFFEKSLDKTRNMLYNYMAFAGVAESADAHVWGACIFDVRVQVPFPAPKKSYHFDTTFFIQTAGLAYHHASACISSALWAVYHHSSECIFLRFDDIQPYGLMIYRNELRMIYKAFALILVRFCAIIFLKRW